MSDALIFTMTNDSVTVFVDGEPKAIKRGAPNFLELRKAIAEEDWEGARNCLSLPGFLERWATGFFELVDGRFYCEGEAMPSELNERIIALASDGKSPEPVMNFWLRLRKNPSMRSVSQVWKFLQLTGIPLSMDGCFLAYKGVRDDFKDCHSGKYDNSPGQVHEMPRNRISDDPNHACHEGFHVGALEYARSFGPTVVICKVDPEHVVCVPYDCSHQKMRVCRYEVVGLHNGEYMSSTVEDDEPLFLNEDDDIRDVYEDLDFDVADVDDYGDDDIDADEALDEIEELEEKPADMFAEIALARSFDALMRFTLEDLRKYASKVLKIVGAYKIPGGKIATIEAIQKHRR
jgi:hypothetical protein